ncbi:MAG: UDP-N-acetylglucosamine 1-carboxyvinyltransferase, partial [Alphaproteobacteria bacterium]|nr:UDP-N-acetylglucosamine 1-carboxyvinyltransferase [Alphaproteobacteria bacterium]
MDKIMIRGGIPLHGQINISGAKNAALPLMAACLLTDKPLRLLNIPELSDIASMTELLSQLGVTIDIDKTPDHTTMHLCAQNILSTIAPYDIVRKMRASVLVL